MVPKSFGELIEVFLLMAILEPKKIAEIGSPFFLLKDVSFAVRIF